MGKKEHKYGPDEIMEMCEKWWDEQLPRSGPIMELEDSRLKIFMEHNKIKEDEVSW